MHVALLQTQLNVGQAHSYERQKHERDALNPIGDSDFCSICTRQNFFVSFVCESEGNWVKGQDLLLLDVMPRLRMYDWLNQYVASFVSARFLSRSIVARLCAPYSQVGMAAPRRHTSSEKYSASAHMGRAILHWLII